MKDLLLKRCARCGELKNGSEFCKDKNGRLELSNYCRACSATSQKEHRERKAKNKARTNQKPSVDGTRLCHQCGERKSLADFSTHSGNRRRGHCKSCDSHNRLKREYDMSLEEFNARVIQQSGECDICENSCPKLNVDHSHKTGKIRSLLCSPCNTALGLVKDSPRILMAMQKYLLKHEFVLDEAS